MRITEAARYLGVSINTLKAMSDSGKIICHRTGGGHRRYHKEYMVDKIAYVHDCWLKWIELECDRSKEGHDALRGWLDRRLIEAGVLNGD